MDLNLLEARPLANIFRNDMTLVIVLEAVMGVVRIIMAHEAKLMSGLQVQMIVMRFFISMLRADMTMHRNGNRVYFDWCVRDSMNRL